MEGDALPTKRTSKATLTGRTAAEVELKLILWIEAHPNATIIKETQTRQRATKPTGLEGTRPGGGMVTVLHIEFTE
jgi:hypothetical protein